MVHAQRKRFRLFKCTIRFNETILVGTLAFLMKKRRNQYNCNLHVLQSNINTNFYNYDWIYFNRAGKHLNVQSKFMYFHIFVSFLNIDINRYQGRVKFKSSTSIQICLYYLSVSLGCFNPGFDFFFQVCRW